MAQPQPKHNPFSSQEMGVGSVAYDLNKHENLNSSLDLENRNNCVCVCFGVGVHEELRVQVLKKITGWHILLYAGITK